MENKLKLLASVVGELRVKQNIDISEFIASSHGGKASGFFLATTTAELIKVIELCKELKIPYLLIGSGTKIALPEQGYAGLVIKNRSSQIKISGIKGKVSAQGIGVEEAFVEADSGVSIQKTHEFSKQNGLSGLVGAADVPGTIGGNLFTNQALQNLAYQASVYSGGEVITKNPEQLKRDDIILSVAFKLKAAV